MFGLFSQKIRRLCSTRCARGEQSFTLIELLIVIAILAVLAIAVVLILNPTELLKESRDTTRIQDLAVVNKALALVETDTPSASLGTSTFVYVSIPDSSATCSNLGLPALPAGYTYACAPTSTVTKTDGTGWIPVNFDSFSAGAPFARLPVDPTNTTSTGLFYTYIPGGSWEMTAIMESADRKMGGRSDATSGDGGQFSEMYEVGTSLTLTPTSWAPFYGLSYDGGDIALNSSPGSTFNVTATGFSLSFWIKPQALTSSQIPFGKSHPENRYLQITGGGIRFALYNGTWQYTNVVPLTANTWNFVAMTATIGAAPYTITVYANTTSTIFDSGTGTFSFSLPNVGLGGDAYNSGSKVANGTRITNFRFWNGTVLSADQIESERTVSSPYLFPTVRPTYALAMPSGNGLSVAPHIGTSAFTLANDSTKSTWVGPGIGLPPTTF